MFTVVGFGAGFGGNKSLLSEAKNKPKSKKVKSKMCSGIPCSEHTIAGCVAMGQLPTFAVVESRFPRGPVR